MTDTNIPNPGSDEAIEAGCICPIIDNHFGKGRPSQEGPMFIMTQGCPIHRWNISPILIQPENAKKEEKDTNEDPEKS